LTHTRCFLQHTWLSLHHWIFVISNRLSLSLHFLLL
jgi:hypothetical protein